MDINTPEGQGISPARMWQAGIRICRGRDMSYDEIQTAFISLLGREENREHERKNKEVK